MRTRPCFALAALLLAAAPLHAQNAGMHRVRAGSFSLEVPAYIPGLERVHEEELAGHRFEMFGGGHVDESVVLVQQGRAAEFSTDTAGMRAGLGRFYRDTALITRYVQALADTAHPEHGEIVRVLRDTTLVNRRWFLHQYRGMWATGSPSRWISISGEPREIVTDERIALRSPIRLQMGEGVPDLYGTVDVVIQRRGEVMVWIVAHAAQQRSAAFDEVTERVLDSFRITGARP
jgi:hypothetical protein